MIELRTCVAPFPLSLFACLSLSRFLCSAISLFVCVHCYGVRLRVRVRVRARLACPLNAILLVDWKVKHFLLSARVQPPTIPQDAPLPSPWPCTMCHFMTTKGIRVYGCASVCVCIRCKIHKRSWCEADRIGWVSWFAWPPYHPDPPSPSCASRSPVVVHKTLDLTTLRCGRS